MLKRLLLASLFVLLTIGTGAWWWLRGSLPVLDGQQPLAGLRAPVQVLFDGAGVPHAYARDAEDAWFTAGALHARDRLWQMELYRRVTAGRLSQVFGASTLPADKRFLTLNLRQSAEAEWARMRPEARVALERYAEGVNAVTHQLSFRQRPIELQWLRVEPAPWTPVDSLAIGRLLAWRLGENHQAELVRGALAARFGTDVARELGGRYPSDGPTVVGGWRGAAPAAAASDVRDTPLGRSIATATGERSAVGPPPSLHLPEGLEWLDPMARRGNSNSWVVAGHRSKSGRPVLANDPHLQVEMPSVWYELHLVADGLNVIGVTIPGAPFVVVGHNARVGWGFTNSGADVQDLYLERLDVVRRHYMARGVWRPLEVTATEIPVKGRATAEPFEIWRTPHGPIFAEASLDWSGPPAFLTPGVSASSSQPADAPATAYALRWDAVAGDIAPGLEALNRANNWSSFVQAVESVVAPSQNIVYADIDGHIGYAMSGRLPTRRSGDGALPVDGASGLGEWGPSIDPATLPRVLDPVSGYIVSANNEIDRSFPGTLTRDWAAPYRATRLHEVLSASSTLDIDQMAALQNDRKSLAAVKVLAGAASALAEAQRRSTDAATTKVLADLAAWDHVVDDRAVVTLYELFEDAVWRRTFVDEMDTPLFDAFYSWAGAERPAGLYAIIDDRQSRWFDDVGTIERRESRDDIFVLAAADAEERMRVEFGGDTSWADAHAIRFAHPVGTVAAPLGWLLSRGPIPMTGDGSTVMRVSWQRLQPFAGWEHPSWRQLLDVGNWDESRVALPAGQSGHIFSRHYFDQNALWRAGGYRPQPFTREAVDRATTHRLLLSGQ